MSIFNELVIFEMANSHQGSVEHGKKIIEEMGKIARKHNIKAAVKLQYRNLETFIHPDFKGRTDVKHIPRFESTRLLYDEFCVLVEAIKENGMIAMSTPFDEDGVGWCMEQNLEIIKVASCSAMDWPLLEEIAATNKPVIISTGGKSLSDIDKIYNFFTHRNCKFAFMHCVAEYPAAFERLQLDYIEKMKKRYRGIEIGYSGHEDPDDSMVPMLAVAKGATFFERHVGYPTDTIKLNAYSMNPAQTDHWVESILRAKNICELKKERDKYISCDELDSLKSLERGVFVKNAISKGQTISRDDVFFAMPCVEKQMTSGEFYDGIIASKDYKANDGLFEKKRYRDINIARDVIHEVKGMLLEAGIVVGDNIEIELSHHYGIKKFRQTGVVIINIVNREYCKKILVVLPGQNHPMHMHKVKEETFQLLYGDLECVVDNKKIHMKPGDCQTVLRNVSHSFKSKDGAIFEEISTTHIKGDSYYEDPVISKMDLMERKTIIRDW